MNVTHQDACNVGDSRWWHPDGFGALRRLAYIVVVCRLGVLHHAVSSTGGSHSVISGFLSQTNVLVGSKLSGSPTFSFSVIVIVRCLSTKQRLQRQLIANYVQQGITQAYHLVGSADIIGNPIGLVEDLGSSVVEFLKITKTELTGDAQTHGEGVKVLGKTIVKSSASSVAKIT